MKWNTVFAALTLILLDMLIGALSLAQTINGTWTVNYFDNEDLQGNPVVSRLEVAPGANWGRNAPAPGLPTDHWSARWTSTQYLIAGERYRMNVAADDGVRVYIGGVAVIDEWHGFTPQTYTYEFTASGATIITIEFFDGTQQAYLNYSLDRVDTFTGTGQWLATYFDNENLAGNPVVSRLEAVPGADWGLNAPAPGLPTDHWSARWTSTQNLAAGRYRISVNADDGVRVFINGLEMISEWHQHDLETYTHDLTISGGQTTITIEMFDQLKQAYLDYSLQRIVAEGPAPQTSADMTASRPSALVTAWVLNVRAEPDLNSPILRQIRRGETYTVRRGSITGWVQLIINGHLGWVNRDFVILTNTEHLVNLAGTAAVQVRAARLNVRSRPSLIGSDIVTKINHGETHPIVGQDSSSEWIMIDVTGSFGWVKRDYVEVETPIPLPVVGDIPPQIPPAREYIVVTATPYTVNLREGPGVSYQDVGNLPLGSQARVIGRTPDDAWWQIEYNGTSAWVAATYARIQENAILKAIPIVANAS